MFHKVYTTLIIIFFVIYIIYLLYYFFIFFHFCNFDEEKIKRVVANIVGNAVKYIQREQGMILVNVEDQGPFIQVMIRDNGKGIGKEELPFIFERFYRTDSSRNSRTGGSGLGLAIAKKIMDEHGGRIWAESELGKGTEVYFTLKKETEQKEEHDE